MALDPVVDDGRHGDAAVEEWVFTTWAVDLSIGAVSGHRVTGRTAWYWAAVVRPGQPLLHVAEWEVPVRAEPGLVKAHGLWAEHVCDAPMEQWTISNETFAAGLDDPGDAIGRAYGVPTAVAFDLEWYAAAPPVARIDGFEQAGVVHGVIELPGAARHLTETPARRWHRWGDELAPLELPNAYAHTDLRAVFAFPDGFVANWALTPDGFRQFAAHDS
ncbi:MAG: hypothetical protein H0U21_03000 [Acidimicrobiia bacterium]|nr:hypothetical protein [Acidimicrobiia bacterium]